MCLFDDLAQTVTRETAGISVQSHLVKVAQKHLLARQPCKRHLVTQAVTEDRQKRHLVTEAVTEDGQKRHLVTVAEAGGQQCHLVTGAVTEGGL